MRENTRCEVDEPISTPTESTHSSSSSPNVRPVEEKKIRPPWDSSFMSQSLQTKSLSSLRGLTRQSMERPRCMDARVNGVPATLASRGARPAHDDVKKLQTHSCGNSPR